MCTTRPVTTSPGLTACRLCSKRRAKVLLAAGRTTPGRRSSFGHQACTPPGMRDLRRRETRNRHSILRPRAWKFKGACARYATTRRSMRVDHRVQRRAPSCRGRSHRRPGAAAHARPLAVAAVARARCRARARPRRPRRPARAELRARAGAHARRRRAVRKNFTSASGKHDGADVPPLHDDAARRRRGVRCSATSRSRTGGTDRRPRDASSPASRRADRRRVTSRPSSEHARAAAAASSANRQVDERVPARRRRRASMPRSRARAPTARYIAPRVDVGDSRARSARRARRACSCRRPPVRRW